MYIYFKKTILFLFFIAFILFTSCNKEDAKNQNPTVEVKYINGKAQLYRHGEPYFIKGAAGTEHLNLVAEFGGNSIRTWSLDDADRILDEAHALGLTVTLGLDIGRPAWGNDFSYWKFWEIDNQIEQLRPFIEKYKNHPALLMWGVGNEVKVYGGGARPVVF
ncbi:MAG TPA: glycoside hydrolase family 2 TIM barrel-domain containing protein, partial [Algoriphagus sp.]|nr:glycoside hydrolase family 2 TIM barrel-domain containing protein [Algoriphagus sp.]